MMAPFARYPGFARAVNARAFAGALCARSVVLMSSRAAVRGRLETWETFEVPRAVIFWGTA